jgi:DNA modification methylase
MKSIRRFWTNPILVDESGTILAGHGRLEAARRLGMTEVPTVTVSGLSDSDKRTVVIADNRLPEQAVWDFDLLRGHFQDLIKLDFDVELTGFSTGEVDLLIDGSQQPPAADPADDLVGLDPEGLAVSKFGDVWELGRHRLVCGDGRRGETYERLLRGDLAEMMVTDPSCAVQVNGQAMGRGKVHHAEFPMASGEILGAAFTTFLDRFIRSAVSASRDGAIHYIFMDWRHLHELLDAALPLYSEWKDLLVWNKSTAGQGSFYHSKHELITVFKSGTGPHINNLELGGQGRYRTNVLDYPGVNSRHPARQGDLELQPTVKPVALIADLIRDCSRRNGLILDPFGGSGTTILAAERTGRIARVAELDPLDVDLAIRRWQKVTGLPARHAETGLAFVDAETRPGALSPTSSRSAQPQRRASRR